MDGCIKRVGKSIFFVVSLNFRKQHYPIARLKLMPKKPDNNRFLPGYPTTNNLFRTRLNQSQSQKNMIAIAILLSFGGSLTLSIWLSLCAPQSSAPARGCPVRLDVGFSGVMGGGASWVCEALYDVFIWKFVPVPVKQNSTHFFPLGWRQNLCVRYCRPCLTTHCLCESIVRHRLKLSGAVSTKD